VNYQKPVVNTETTISHSFKTNALITERTIQVSEAFGLGVDDEKQFSLYENTALKYKSNDIVYITGDSGSGKSWLLNNHFAKLNNAVNLNDIEIFANTPIIEQLGSNLSKALEYLNIAGLGDAFLYLRTYEQLSDGQKYRFRIAKLLDMQNADVWLIDEFCATLDRITAQIISFNLHKIVKKLGKMLVVATTHDDLTDSLKPNVYIRKGYETDVDVSYRQDEDYADKSFTLHKDMKVEIGNKTDYESLKRFHYRQAELGAVKRIYKCVYQNNVIGVIVICYPHLALKGRNVVFGERFSKMSKESCTELNQIMECISRIIIHPKYRGIGLAQFMLKEYFKLSQCEYVETIAVMANYNPFFEKAGMTRVDTEDDLKRLEKIKELEAFGFQINLISSKKYIDKHFKTLSTVDQEKVKAIVAKILNRYKGQITKLFANKATVEEVIEKDLFGAMKELPRADTVYLYKKLK
jgi:ABC-type ATPase with predicted acetyltransferase domain